MKNDDYWAKREQNERKWIDDNIKNDKDFDKVLEQHYNKLADDIMSKINNEYLSLAKNSGYTMADAQAKVKAADIAKFETEAKSLVKQAREIYKANGKVEYADFTDQVNERMKLYNATMRINRLEMLKAQIGEDVVQAGINVNSEINDKLKDDALKEFKRQSGILGRDKAKPDLKELTKIISAQTGDVSFSDRIWQDQSSLKAELDVLLTRQMVRGISPIEIARDLKNLVSSKVNSSRYAAERIARTESARVQTQVQLAIFDKYDINYCHWIAEPTACQICTDISENNDGMGEGIYSTTEVPFLPAHPNCRCSLSAYEPDEAQLERKGIVNNNNLPEAMKYGYDDFEFSDEAQKIVQNISENDIISVIHDMNDQGSKERGDDQINNRRSRMQLKLANELGYNELPTILNSDDFDKVVSNPLVRYTSRYNELMKGDLEYSINKASELGHAIYSAFPTSDVDSYGEFYGDEAKKLSIGIAKDAKIGNYRDIYKKWLNTTGSFPENEFQAYEKTYMNDMDGSVAFDMLAMKAGLDGYYDPSNGYMMMLNRGKMIIKEMK